MKKQTYPIEIFDEKIFNIDVIDADNFIAITESCNVLFKGIKLELKINFKFPIIRKLNEDLFLVADSRTNTKENGMIYHSNGSLIKRFYIGDGIEDIIIHYEKIIVSYFDEGVFGEEGPNNEGLAIFNFEGILEYGMCSDGEYFDISDCYAICKKEEDKILFFAYTDFDICELNLQTFELKKKKVPKKLHGSTSISSNEENIYFHSSYSSKYKIFKLDRTLKIEEVGSCREKLKGLEYGKFYSYNDNSYTILEVN